MRDPESVALLPPAKEHRRGARSHHLTENRARNGARNRRSGGQSVIAKTTCAKGAGMGRQGIAEVGRGALWIVVEGATAPGAEHQSGVVKRPRGLHDPRDALLEQIARARLADLGGVGRRAGQEAQWPWPLVRCAVVSAEHRDIGRGDRPVGRVGQGAPSARSTRPAIKPGRSISARRSPTTWTI